MAEAPQNGIFWLASYPKSGNTWFRGFLTALMQADDAPIDINRLDTPFMASSRHWLDSVLGFDTSDLTQAETDRLRPLVYDWPAANTAVRYHKTHDAFASFADGAPMFNGCRTLGSLYIIRNPLDVAIAYSHHLGCDLDTAIANMEDPAHGLNTSRDRIVLQVRQFMGSWSHHVISWVDAPGLNCHVIRYEDMHIDAAASFAKAARFLGLRHDGASVQNALKHCAFDTMKQQELLAGFDERPPGMPSFFRNGRTGDWRTQLSDDQVARVIESHHVAMTRFGYLDAAGKPV